MKRLILALALLCAAPAHAAYKLIEARMPVAVAKSGLTVTPPEAWNKIPYGAGKRSESWTLDGLNLNELEFFADIENGKPLVREIDKRDRPLPRFNAGMLAPDIVALYETTLRTVSQTASYTTDSVEPATFAGAPGVRFTFSYTLQDEVKRRGEAVGAVIGGKLYLAVFTAAATHYFPRDVAQFREIAASARVLPKAAG